MSLKYEPSLELLHITAKPFRDMGNLLPSNQRQHRSLHVEKDVLPYALCQLLCPIQKSVSLKYEPASEPLHISVKQLFLN